MATIGPLQQQRHFDEARPLVESLLQLQPKQPEALHNLGVLANEAGRLEEARLLLLRAVVANAHAQNNAQVALALAAMRLGNKADARQALDAAIELEPQSAFALRSLDSLLLIAGALAAGAERYRQALAVAPDDLINTFNLSQALLELDPDEHRDEADRLLLLRVIEAQPYGELAAKAKDLRGSIASRDLRTEQPNGLRQDAVSYCFQALQLFEGMEQQRFMAVLSEVAAVRQGGLQINEPGTSRSLKPLPRTWSDLALACLIHVGMKRLMPVEESGLGIGSEYEEAVRLRITMRPKQCTCCIVLAWPDGKGEARLRLGYGGGKLGQSDTAIYARPASAGGAPMTARLITLPHVARPSGLFVLKVFRLEAP